MRALVFALALVGCAGAPAPRPLGADARPALRERPAAGARYVTRFELRYLLHDRTLRAQRVLTSTVVASDADGALLEHRVDAGGFDLLDPRLVLPPTRDALVGAVLRERRDARGRRAGALQLVEGTDAQREELAQSALEQTVGSPALPAETIEVGLTWTAPARWAYRIGGAPVEQRRDVTYRVTAIEAGVARIEVRGETSGEGGRVAVDGELEVDLADALIARGRLVGTAGPEDGAPRYELRWRTDPEGRAPTEEDVAGVLRSRVLEGAECQARVAELSARLDAAPVGMPIATDLPVPSAPRGGDVPWGLLLVIDPQGGLRLDGREVEPDRAVEDLGTFARNAAVLAPGHEGPVNVVVVGAADAPLAPLAALLARTGEHALAWSLVVRVPDAPPLPPRFAPSTPPPIAMLAESLEPGTLATLAVGTCTPLVTAFGESAGLGPEGLWAHHRVSVPAALRACECRGADVDLVDGLLAGLAAGGRDPALRALAVPRDLRPLRLRRGATLGDLGRALSAAP